MDDTTGCRHTLCKGTIPLSLACSSHCPQCNLRDEVARVRQGRQQVQEKMRRLAKAYMNNLVDEDDYERQKLRYEMELESLVVPEADAVAEAGRLVERLPELWAKATLSERRKLLLTVLDAVYVDARKARAVVSIMTKATFMLVLDLSPVGGQLTNEPSHSLSLFAQPESAFMTKANSL